jgi:hypothetical protein
VNAESSEREGQSPPPTGDAGWGAPAEESERPLEEQLPPDIIATPSEIRGPDEGIMWWRPGWGDAWRYVGYRWVFLLPALGYIVLAVVVYRWQALLGALWPLVFKLSMLVAAIAAWLAGVVIRRAVHARREPFCIYCGYNLTGLPDNYRCPECGRPYTWKLIAEYRRDPQWFIERYRAHHRLPAAEQPFAAAPGRQKSRDGT